MALTPGNVISGFTKTRIFPLSPGRITDSQKAPSTVHDMLKVTIHNLLAQSLSNSSQSPLQNNIMSGAVSHSSGPLNLLALVHKDLLHVVYSKSLSIDEILTIPKAAAKAQKKTIELACQTLLSMCRRARFFSDCVIKSRRARFFSDCVIKRLLERKNKDKVES